MTSAKNFCNTWQLSRINANFLQHNNKSRQTIKVALLSSTGQWSGCHSVTNVPVKHAVIVSGLSPRHQNGFPSVQKVVSKFIGLIWKTCDRMRQCLNGNIHFVSACCNVNRRPIRATCKTGLQYRHPIFIGHGAQQQVHFLRTCLTISARNVKTISLIFIAPCGAIQHQLCFSNQRGCQHSQRHSKHLNIKPLLGKQCVDGFFHCQNRLRSLRNIKFAIP